MARIPDWEDDDDDAGTPRDVVKVQIENRYFDKLRARLGPRAKPAPESATAEPEKTKGPGFVIYGDDGRPLK